MDNYSENIMETEENGEISIHSLLQNIPAISLHQWGHNLRIPNL